MIFRLSGNIEETLALTPIMKEWKALNGGKVWADTLYPELFEYNPYVDGIISDKVKSDWVLDFNNIDWQGNLKPVVESFGEFLFGKVKFRNWRTIMCHSSDDENVAKQLISSKNNIAIVSDRINKDVDVVLTQRGYEVLRLPEESFGSWRIFHAVASMASLYIGFDNGATAVALTTDVPAVVVYTSRNPIYFTPFRRDVPFEAIVPAKEICDMFETCLETNGLFEAGKTYGLKCSKSEIFCQKELGMECIMNAVDKICEKA